MRFFAKKKSLDHLGDDDGIVTVRDQDTVTILTGSTASSRKMGSGGESRSPRERKRICEEKACLLMPVAVFVGLVLMLWVVLGVIKGNDGNSPNGRPTPPTMSTQAPSDGSLLPAGTAATFRPTVPPSIASTGVSTTTSSTASLVSGKPERNPSFAPTELSTRHSSTIEPTTNPSSSPVSAEATESPEPSPTEGPTLSPSLRPLSAEATQSPVTSPTEGPTLSPSLRPLSAEATQSPVTSPTEGPTVGPSVRVPTLPPTLGHSTSYRPTGSLMNDPPVTTFNLLSGKFLQDDVSISKLASFGSADDEGDFIVQLGGAIASSDGECAEGSFKEIRENYQHSPLPVYMVPGEDYWSRCPDPELALDYWTSHLAGPTFDDANLGWVEARAGRYGIQRQNGQIENFGFLHQRVLFVGVNAFRGPPSESFNDWLAQTANSIQWIEENVQEYDEGDFDTMVLFIGANIEAHGGPTPMVYFWAEVKMLLRQYPWSILYVEPVAGESTSSWEIETSTDGIGGLTRLTVDEAAWPPLRVSVDATKGTFQIGRGESDVMTIGGEQDVADLVEGSGPISEGGPEEKNKSARDYPRRWHKASNNGN